MKFIIRKNSNKKKGLPAGRRGFTMIELLIAIAIFIIVIAIVFSLFLTSLKSQRKTIAIQNVQDNARFLLEFIAKEVRMSTIRDLTYNGEVSDLYITRHDGEDIDYSFNATDKTIERFDSTGSGGPISSEEISVTGKFYVEGFGCADSLQPKVTIVLKVTTAEPEKAEIVVQTALSLRNLEMVSLLPLSECP
jgi:prepilin-type N-terminal cleavage/methylation domain-containing protein